jgi:hypothetical protein
MIPIQEAYEDIGDGRGIESMGGGRRLIFPTEIRASFTHRSVVPAASVIILPLSMMIS